MPTPLVDYQRRVLPLGFARSASVLIICFIGCVSTVHAIVNMYIIVEKPVVTLNYIYSYSGGEYLLVQQYLNGENATLKP